MLPPDCTTVFFANRIAELRAGNLAARNELVGRASARLEVMARRMRRNFRLDPMFDTGDILQEASIRLMRALERVEINDVRHFLNLSAVKIRQTLLDLVRRPVLPKARAFNDDSSGGQAAIDQIGTVTLDPASLARWTEFHEAIEKLPDDQREIVNLLWYQELTQAEAAEVLGVAEKTVQRRWLRVRLQLGNLLSA